jgi:hypothetical protein
MTFIATLDEYTSLTKPPLCEKSRSMITKLSPKAANLHSKQQETKVILGNPNLDYTKS